MIDQIINNAGTINFVSFLGISLAQSVKLIEFAEGWTTLMFAISGTAAVIHTLIKIINWCKNYKKNKNNE